MLFLLLAIALCLLVPWLPVVMYRCFPRRPPLPPAAGQLQRLAVDLQHPGPPDTIEALVDDGPPTTDISRRTKGSPDNPKRDGEEPTEGSNPVQTTGDNKSRKPKNATASRLTVRSYQWLNLLFVPVFIVTFLGLAVGWAALLHSFGEEHARTFEPGVFLFKPFAYGLIFAVPALFLGIFSAIPLLVLLAYCLLGRQRFLEYLFWDEGRLSDQGRPPEGIIRMLSGLALLVGVLSALFIGLAMNWYARFTEDGIAIKRLFAVGEEMHPYNSVDQIVVTTHRQVGKEILVGEDLGLHFTDGRVWRTGQTFVMPRDPAERDRFLDLLQRKTRKPITRARLLTDVPGW